MSVLYMQAKQAISSYIGMTKNPVVCVTAIATNFAGIDFNDNFHNDLLAQKSLSSSLVNQMFLTVWKFCHIKSDMS